MSTPMIRPARQQRAVSVSGSDVTRSLRAASQRHVDEFQRARLLEAMAEIACEVGPEHATVTKVVARAGLSRRTFYDLFARREECLLVLVQETLDRTAVMVRRAYRGDGPWVERLRMALFELLALIDEQRELARLCLSRLYADDPALAPYRKRLLGALSAGLDEGRDGAPAPTQPPPATAEGLLYAVASMIYMQLLDRQDAPATRLLGPLMSLLVMPYLGSEAALRELSQPAPARVASPRLAWSAANGRPRARPRVRVTYRTARVLEVIAEQPDVSNRGVADAAGIKDQGQISKLLARLERLGLVVNAPVAATNAWRLTPEGEALTRAVAQARPKRG